jgi:hypothetical protein
LDRNGLDRSCVAATACPKKRGLAGWLLLLKGKEA